MEVRVLPAAEARQVAAHGDERAERRVDDHRQGQGVVHHGPGPLPSLDLPPDPRARRMGQEGVIRGPDGLDTIQVVRTEEHPPGDIVGLYRQWLNTDHLPVV